jgi:predicted DCC family thiol-disulfide oxidoreductase YuxK
MVTGLPLAQTLTVLYDRDCGICTATARALVRLDARGSLVFQPLQLWQSPNGPSRTELERVLHVVDDRGRWSSGGAAMLEIARRVPALRAVAVTARIPGATVVLELTYRFVADHRHQLSALLGLKACPVPARSGEPAG